MKKMVYKTLIASVILSSFLAGNVFASETNNVVDTNAVSTKTSISKTIDLNDLKDQEIQTLGASKIVKGAIKVIINNKTGATNVVRAVGGNKAANVFSKAYGSLVKELKPLLKWSEVPANAVGDAANRAGINAGLSKGDAGILKTVLKEAIAWLV